MCLQRAFLLPQRLFLLFQLFLLKLLLLFLLLPLLLLLTFIVALLLAITHLLLLHGLQVSFRQWCERLRRRWRWRQCDGRRRWHQS